MFYPTKIKGVPVGDEKYWLAFYDSFRDGCIDHLDSVEASMVIRIAQAKPGDQVTITLADIVFDQKYDNRLRDLVAMHGKLIHFHYIDKLDVYNQYGIYSGLGSHDFSILDGFDLNQFIGKTIMQGTLESLVLISKEEPDRRMMSEH